jgi:hypothetical protein
MHIYIYIYINVYCKNKNILKFCINLKNIKNLTLENQLASQN